MWAGYQAVGVQRIGAKTSTVLNASSSRSPSNSVTAIRASCQRSDALGDCLFLPFLVDKKDGTVDKTVAIFELQCSDAKERDSNPGSYVYDNYDAVRFQK